MEAILDALMPYILGIVGTIGALLLFYVGRVANGVMEKYDIRQSLKNNERIVKISVDYVQQVYKELNGDEKLQKAKDKARAIMAEKGINITNEELEGLIEQAVLGFKQGVNEPTTVVIDPITVKDAELIDWANHIDGVHIEGTTVATETKEDINV